MVCSAWTVIWRRWVNWRPAPTRAARAEGGALAAWPVAWLEELALLPEDQQAALLAEAKGRDMRIRSLADASVMFARSAPCVMLPASATLTNSRKSIRSNLVDIRTSLRLYLSHT